MTTIVYPDDRAAQRGHVDRNTIIQVVSDDGSINTKLLVNQKGELKNCKISDAPLARQVLQYEETITQCAHRAQKQTLRNRLFKFMKDLKGVGATSLTLPHLRNEDEERFAKDIWQEVANTVHASIRLNFA